MMYRVVSNSPDRFWADRQAEGLPAHRITLPQIDPPARAGDVLNIEVQRISVTEVAVAAE